MYVIPTIFEFSKLSATCHSLPCSLTEDQHFDHKFQLKWFGVRNLIRVIEIESQNKLGEDSAITYFDIVAIRVPDEDLVDNVFLISCWHRNINLEIDRWSQGSEPFNDAIDIMRF